MDIGHQHVVVADSGNALTQRRAAMDGHEFPDDIVIPDFGVGKFAAELHVMGNTPDGGKGENLVVLANTGMALNHGMRHHHGAFADLDVFVNPRVRAHGHVNGDLSAGMNNGGWMSFHGP